MWCSDPSCFGLCARMSVVAIRQREISSGQVCPLRCALRRSANRRSFASRRSARLRSAERSLTSRDHSTRFLPMLWILTVATLILAGCAAGTSPVRTGPLAGENWEATNPTLQQYPEDANQMRWHYLLRLRDVSGAGLHLTRFRVLTFIASRHN